ncbi:hypothetical protein BH20ACI1_BH20ACI1_14220 [soil metagenome]
MNYFWKLVLIALLVISVPTSGTAQEKPTNEKKQKVQELVVDGVQLIIETLREKQRKSMEKSRADNSSCFKFSAPVFNPFNVTFDDQNTPRCHDFPVIDVAKDTGNPNFAKSASEYNSIRKFSAGDQLVVLLYLNNGADASLNTNKTVARNVKIITSIQKEDNLHRISATFTGDNMKSVIGKVNVLVGSNEDLVVIPNSGFMYAYDGTIIANPMGFNLGNSALNLGELDAGVQYSLFFSYKIKVVKKQSNRP